MKAKCVCQFIFQLSEKEKWACEVKGKISLPGLIYKQTDDRDQQTMVESETGGQELFRIENVEWLVRKGVWTPIVTLDYSYTIEALSTITWTQIKEDIAETFLPGYEFFWDGHGKKPYDWVPEDFAEVFDTKS